MEPARISRRTTIAGGAALALAGTVVRLNPASTQAAWPTGTLQIMAPAAPGGGWDTTAREIQRVLGEEGIVTGDVEVFNVEGAGGTIGLAELVNDHAGDENVLMVMGLVMIGGIGLNQSPITLDSVTPIARLTGEFEVIVVPANSPYETLDALLADFTADPTAISWGGGSAGGTDHILIALIAQELGIDPTLVNYVPFSGGGEALASVMGGQTTAGVSGLGEWAAQIEAGELRALALSGRAAPVEGATPAASGGTLADTIPTLQEQGVDIELANWRGIVAPPELSDESVATIVATFDTFNASAGWQDALVTNGWTDLYLAGDAFDAYLTEQIETINATLTELGLI
ncbi:MAG TPA: tripartite tricarboxylate transporter substrate-binding protein [Thermomicrobiales bacterium]|nr:tripartite tricarboxylate transporter substrate-binding protein [Thermomicrobiales bacterium]